MKLDRIKILVIEDTKPMLDLISSVLDAIGVGQVYTTTNAEEGCEITKKVDPDIIFCDWEMPGFNGIEFTKEVRTNHAYSNRTVPIILITGYGMISKVGEARDAGVTEYIVKPFTAAQLSKRIEYVVHNPRDFIESKNYTGPDRRRKQDPSYKGPFRRDSDKK